MSSISLEVEETVPIYHRSIDKDSSFNIADQIYLLIWKRFRELSNQKRNFYKVFVPPVIVFIFLILVYMVTTLNNGQLFYPGGIEQYIVPIGFLVYLQSMVVQITGEKSSKIQESLRMMGMNDISYWISYIVTDGFILGFMISLVCSLLSLYGLFNDAEFYDIFFMIYSFTLSMIPVAFFVSSFFDTIGSASNASLGVALGSYVCYIAFDLDTTSIGTQVLFSLFPPIAFQIACGSFKNSYVYDNRLSTYSISFIMIIDFFIFSILSWYVAQIFPSEFGIKRPWWFIFDRNYWFPNNDIPNDIPNNNLFNAENNSSKYLTELVDEKKTGNPTIKIQQIKKTFGKSTVVNGVSLEMYENQIFALLGHNGAGKSTIINILTGMIDPDSSHGDAFIYNNSIRTEMHKIRKTMGVCPQHDVLFENLTVREHIIFFAQLKGVSYDQASREAESLTNIFHLNERLDHHGHELSGGQRRKLSVSIAICGGSKFIVLDEPTAGMDPLARREFWDLLASLKQDRSILLTTHYMDEADVLGDRIGIMSLGEMQCLGSSDFLKRTFGIGYKLLIEKETTMTKKDVSLLTEFIQSHITDAIFATVKEHENADNQLLYTLPFSTVKKFGDLFLEMDLKLNELKIKSYGIVITSLTDVFLKIGEDHSVKPNNELLSNECYGIGSSKKYESSMFKQIIGIFMRRLNIARHDLVTIPLILLPLAASIMAAVTFKDDLISNNSQVKYIVSVVIIMVGYLGVPGLIAEFLCRERKDRLRNVLTIMGCDFRAYWIGTFLSDMILMLPIIIATFISWPIADMGSFEEKDSHSGIVEYNGFSGFTPYFLIILFVIQMIGMSYFFSFIFGNPKSCIVFMPAVIIVLLILPNIFVFLYVLCSYSLGTTIATSNLGGFILWGIAICSPHGALTCALLDIAFDLSSYLDQFPDHSSTMIIMAIETVLYYAAAYWFDVRSVSTIPLKMDETFDDSKLLSLDSDILDERKRTEEEKLKKSDNTPLTIERLRKVFPSKRVGGNSVEAVQDLSITVQKNEIFGLLGANGSGKSTTLSMLTRHILPTAGDAHLSGYSILSEFSKGATHLGVVTQNNSLWDLMTVYDHLELFGRLRGIPEDTLKNIVYGTLDQLELTPHKYKLSKDLSGGMKRKLCVAIALIGDPSIVLLDEPSAGLDPVSQHNLWNVILRTMSHRSVILTTHSMEEAEVLCKRISIMVKGQLRAIGTKQYLKKKYGSGYELSVKINIVNFIEQSNSINSFVSNIFPSSRLLSENGGLLTFEIDVNEMNIGLAFNEIEKNKDNLSIIDYSISQPTLEQVFIKTVLAHSLVQTETNNPLRKSLGLTSGQHYENGILYGVPKETEKLESGDEIELLNKCGITNKSTKYRAIIFGSISFFSFILMIISGSLNIQIVSTLIAIVFIISLVISCSMCWTLCCPCFQYTKGLEE